VELLRVQNEATNTRADRLARQAVLNQLIGQAPETPLTVALPVEPALLDLLRTGGEAVAASPAATPPANGSIFTQRADLLAAQINRPDIVSARATLESKQAQVTEIGRQRLPQFELQARRSASFGRDGSYAARAVVTMPLLDLGSIRREKQAAQSEVQAQQAQIRLLESQAGAQLEQALVSLDQQQATVERYRGGIVPQTLDLLRKTQVGFAQGASSYLEVLEAQRTLRQVQTEYLQASGRCAHCPGRAGERSGHYPAARVVRYPINGYRCQRRR
jgi:Outer membrane protein